MSCLCDLTRPIPQCIEEIIVGYVTSGLEVIVQFTEIITSRKETVEATADENGLITVDVTDIQEFFSPNFIYELRVISNGLSIEFGIDGVTVDCLQVQFEQGEAESATLNLTTTSNEAMLIYKVLITQSGTNAPTVTILQNTLGFTPEWVYDEPGYYHISNEIFAPENTFFLITDAQAAPYFHSAGAVYQIDGVNSFQIAVYDLTDEAFKNGLLVNTPLEIQIRL